MVGSTNNGARLLGDDDGWRDMQRNIRRCISTGRERGWLIIRRHGGKLWWCSWGERRLYRGGGSYRERLLVLVLGNWKAWVVGHYDGGRHREAQGNTQII